MFDIKVLVLTFAVFLAFANADDVNAEILRVHNSARKNHGCPPLVINKKLNTYAQEWAEYLASRNEMTHRPNSIYGENYARSNPFIGAINTAVEWYAEASLYDFKNPGYSAKTANFTQMVWKNTKEIGIGIAVAKDKTTYVVANYHPIGNIHGQFQKNVPKAKLFSKIHNL